ncbi:MAG TPA: hypothetical protein VN700_19935 [Vicinamibacterales bacterium]|nr:hypothetical protein [Vicinamibacterales bacterium]
MRPAVIVACLVAVFGGLNHLRQGYGGPPKLYAKAEPADYGSAAHADGSQAAPFDSRLFSEFRWRPIGPFRGGRTKAVDGVASAPHLFYVGAVNGGVWKTTDAGRTWAPIFDDQPAGSIGAIAVAPSDPNVIYVGTGEGMQRPDLSTGDGLYKSIDAGATWTHLGLRDGQQIPQIVVDPANPNRLFVAVLGHPYGPSTERGIYRSTDGGRTFECVLYKDENTGGVDLALDPADANTIYASLWESRQGPWENAAWTGPGSGLFKSEDGGSTWRQLTQGLPSFADGLGRIGITVAPTRRTRLFAVVDAGAQGGIYRSDDAGATWSRVNADPRLVARASDAADIRVDPANPDVVYVPTIVAWKSTDGGRTFTALRGAPGGDDYQKIWINPRQPGVMILTSDQGAVVSLNGGASWSSWYNQPTAQFYHVSTDNAFPYRVCGGQQESGSACVSSRGPHGQITMREWAPVGVEEYGFVAPDPLDPDVVYGGKVTRFDRRTGQTQFVGPPTDGDYRVLRTQPLMFLPTDARSMLFASNTLWKSSNGGTNWAAISPDLSRATWEPPPTIGVYRDRASARPSRRGVIYAVAPSPIDANVIWAGTDDGLIHATRNGGVNWVDVTPPALVAWAKVAGIEASHFDPGTAYAAVNALRLDDLRPHVYRTRDGGQRWVEITQGLPDGGVINVVREDPQRRGLLFAGSEQAVHVSFDDGDSWQPLRLNMPVTSIRDLAIKDADLVAATHGRGFWILDDIAPLRQITRDIARAPAYLFRPPQAWRVRSNTNTDTPLPPDEPAAPNPPEGVVISYLLAQPVPATVEIEIADGATGEVIRRLSSADPPEAPVAGRNIPDYWLSPPQRVATSAGLHRIVWDLRYGPPPVEERGYPSAAVRGNTPIEPRGLLVMPGTYQVRLSAGGQVFRQAVTVRMDPRVRTSIADLTVQFKLSKGVDAMLRRLSAARAAGSARAAEIAAAMLQIASLFPLLQDADARPTPALESAVTAALSRAEALLRPR